MQEYHHAIGVLLVARVLREVLFCSGDGNDLSLLLGSLGGGGGGGRMIERAFGILASFNRLETRGVGRHPSETRAPYHTQKKNTRGAFPM